MQILNVNHSQLTAEYIRCRIDNHDQYFATTECDEATDVDASEQYFHARLGSAQKQMTFESVEKANHNDKRFERFRIRLNDFLNNYFRIVRGSFPGDKPVHFSGNDTVSCHILVSLLPLTVNTILYLIDHRVSVHTSQLRVFGRLVSVYGLPPLQSCLPRKATL